MAVRGRVSPALARIRMTTSSTPPCGRDGGHAEFDLLAARLPELDLAVLGKAPDGDVEVRHDLDAGNDGRTVAVGKGLVDGAVAVDPVADLDVLLGHVGFDVDIGGAFGLGVEDDLVDELHDDAVRFGDRTLLLFVRLLIRIELSEDIGDGWIRPPGD